LWTFGVGLLEFWASGVGLLESWASGAGLLEFWAFGAGLIYVKFEISVLECLMNNSLLGVECSYRRQLRNPVRTCSPKVHYATVFELV